MNMPRCARLVFLLGVVVVASPPLAAAQPPAPASIQAEMLKDWTDLKATLMKIADAMPPEGYSFRPTPPQETFGRRVVHIGVGANRFLQGLGSKVPAPVIDAGTAAMTKESAMKAMADVFDYGTAILKEQTDQTML